MQNQRVIPNVTTRGRDFSTFVFSVNNAVKYLISLTNSPSILELDFQHLHRSCDNYLWQHKKCQVMASPATLSINLFNTLVVGILIVLDKLVVCVSTGTH